MGIVSWYDDDYHQTYDVSPMARPNAIVVEAGEDGEVPVNAVANLRDKRLPWEEPEELISREYDFTRGGVLFPAGVYRFTFENNLVYPQAVFDLDYDFFFPYFVWIWTAQRWANFYDVEGFGVWTTAPFSPYNDSNTYAQSTRIASYMAVMDNVGDWEANGLDCVLRFPSGIKILAMTARLGTYQKAAHPYDINATGEVNPLLLRVASQGDSYYAFANDNSH